MPNIKEVGGFILLLMGAQATQAVVEVSIIDPEHPEGKICSGFQQMSSEPERLSLTFSENCVGTVSANSGQPQVENHTLSVTGGTSKRIDVSNQAVVKLPLGAAPVQIVDHPGDGTVVTSGTDVIYTANATDTSLQDSFTYKIMDATGQYSNKATVSVNIAAGGGSNGGSGSTCKTGGIIVCKGSHGNITNGGQIQNIPVGAGLIHVWEFEYINRASTESIRIFESSVEMDVTINKNAGDMNDAAYASCKLQDMAISITANTSYSNWSCPLKEGDTYFLNVRNKESASGQYGLVR